MSTSPKSVCEHPGFSRQEGWGNHSAINLKKKSNKLIPYQHFKVEGLHYLRYMLQQEDYMWK